MLDVTPRLRESETNAFARVNRRFPALREFHHGLGKTRLVEVPSFDGGARIFAKCEMENPAGSIKDRTAYALLAGVLDRTPDDALAKLKIHEYSGGNLARALARLTNALSIPTRLVLSSSSPKSLLDDLERNRAEVVLVDKALGFTAVIEEAVRIAAADTSWTFLYQHQNLANVDFHRVSTGVEIVTQLAGRRPDAWVASIGTGGTFIGVGLALRATNHALKIYGVTPAELPYGSLEPPNGLPKYAGSGGFGYGKKQFFVEPHEPLITGHRHVTYGEAMAGMAELHAATGMRVGSSAAANWLSARAIAREMAPNETVVTVFPCAGSPEEWRQLGRGD